jgi:diguanylate cyclase (GGDEF)-like protein
MQTENSDKQTVVENQPRRARNARQEREPLAASDLSRLQVLRGVAPESVWGLLEHCPIVNLPSGRTLINKGDRNQTMFMILSGRLRVHLDNGSRGPVIHLDRGQVVGELSVIDNSPASATVVAACPTRLLAVDEATFWRLVAASHEFATNLLMSMASRMRSNNSAILENMRTQRKLQQQATIDVLTGLRNRRWLDENLGRFVERNKRSGEPLSVLMLDVDRFKSFNDRHGHAAGDQALALVAQGIMTRLRPSDRGARYGGEEFAVIMPATDLEGACTAADRLRRAVAETPIESRDGKKLPFVTISVGVAQLHEQDTASTLLERADRALYAAKADGRNRVVRQQPVGEEQVG